MKSSKAVFLKPNSLRENISLTILDAKEEVRYDIGAGFIVVDVVISTQEMGDVFIEILNTHKTDKEKVRKVSAIGRPCIEIDVSHFARILHDGEADALDSKSFVQTITKPGINGTWLFIPQDQPYVQDLINELRKDLHNEYKDVQKQYKDENQRLKEQVAELTTYCDSLRRKIHEQQNVVQASQNTMRQAQKIVDGDDDSKLKKGASIGYAFKGKGRCVYIYIKRELVGNVETKLDKKGNVVIPLKLYKKYDDDLEIVANSGKPSMRNWY